MNADGLDKTELASEAVIAIGVQQHLRRETAPRVVYEASRTISVMSLWLRESVIMKSRFLQQSLFLEVIVY